MVPSPPARACSRHAFRWSRIPFAAASGGGAQRIVSELLVSDRIARSVSRVTATMLGLTFRVVVRETPVERWRTVILSIPGARPVTVALSSDRRGCAALTSAMLGMDEDGLDVDMIDDFMRELVNMTAGQLKIELALDQALGLPRVLDGDVLFASQQSWAHHVLDSDSINLVVSLLSGIA
jgi:CheY-specific phosphatase CheX